MSVFYVKTAKIRWRLGHSPQTPDCTPPLRQILGAPLIHVPPVRKFLRTPLPMFDLSWNIIFLFGLHI